MLYKSACQQQERLRVVHISMSATGEAKVLYKSACQQQERLNVVPVSMSATGEAKCCTSQHVSNRRG